MDPDASSAAIPPEVWAGGGQKLFNLGTGNLGSDVRPGLSSRSLSAQQLLSHEALSSLRSWTMAPEDARHDMSNLLGKLQRRVQVAHDPSSCLVITNGNPFRMVWSVFVVILLVYIGTIFLYRLSFLEFRVYSAHDGVHELEFDAGPGWQSVDLFLTVSFWIDLVVNFLFSYEDEAGKEVVSLRAIVRHYLSTYFIIDLIACLPEETFSHLFSGMSSASLTQGAKAFRLQRMTRLARLMRLTRLVKISRNMKGPMWSWLKTKRGFHVVNLTVGLAWIVHVLACGWYMCAALHENPKDTWLNRRTVDAAGDKYLIDSPPIDQWAHSMYFTLTVFTTVGFGDISAMTNGEITYVCFMMLVGAVVHSIIISSVIQVVTSSDQVHDFIHKNSKLVEAFSAHTEIGEGAQHEMLSWVTMSAKYWIRHQYDKQEMRDLIVGKIMPSHLLARLPSELFGGKLITNTFFSRRYGHMDLPPRLPLLVALSMQKATFFKGTIIYQVEEYAFSLFLVLSGTFAYVAQPADAGGVSDRQHLVRTSSKSLGSVKVPVGSRSHPSVPGHAALEAAKALEGALACEKLQHDWCPYRVFCHGSYFGDIEVFQNCLRLSTARCESTSGTLLIIHKADLKELLVEFPHFAVKWRVEARRREQAKARLLKDLTGPQSHEDLAGLQIARWWLQVKRGQLLRASAAAAVFTTMVECRSVQDTSRKNTKAETVDEHEAKVDAEHGRQITMASLAAAQDGIREDLRDLTGKVDLILKALSRGFPLSL